MPIVLTLYLMLVCSPVPWPAPWLGGSPATCGVATVGLLTIVLLRFVYISGRTLRLLQEPYRHDEALILYSHARGRAMFWLMGAFGLGLTLGGYGWAVQTALADADGNLFPGAEIVLIAPFLAALVGSWVAFYPVERRVMRAPRLLSYVLFHFRQQVVLALLPLTLVILEQSAMRHAGDLVSETWFHITSISVVASILIMAPWLLRAFLGWQPLPAGPLRDRLVATARRLGFRYSDLMLWPTHGAVANAMVAGLLPWPRYVVMTDRLLVELTPDELEAVLGHEIGHVRHRHMLLYFVFLGLSVCAFFGLITMAERSLADDSSLRSKLVWLGEWNTLVSLVAMAVYVLFAFGFLSRRCEREADLFGCRAVSCPRPDCAGHVDDLRVAPVTTSTTPCPTAIDIFTSALDRVAVANGMSRSKPGWLSSWQHSTIERRVEFLEGVKANRTTEQRFRRRMRVFKFVVVLGLAAVVAWLVHRGDLSLS